MQKAFIGTPAIHHEFGLTHPEEELVRAKQHMISVAQQVIVVADSTKIDKVSLHTIAPLSAIHTLITGAETSDTQRKRFSESGVAVLTV